MKAKLVALISKAVAWATSLGVPAVWLMPIRNRLPGFSLVGHWSIEGIEMLRGYGGDGGGDTTCMYLDGEEVTTLVIPSDGRYHHVVMSRRRRWPTRSVKDWSPKDKHRSVKDWSPSEGGSVIRIHNRRLIDGEIRLGQAD